MPRKVAPLLLWFAARGWALGGAVVGMAVATLTRPPYFLVNQGWFTVGAFAVAALLMAALACWPWVDWLRKLAVTSMVFAVLSRSFGLAILGQGSLRARMIGTLAWLLVGYYTLLLGVVTLRAGRRAR